MTRERRPRALLLDVWIAAELVDSLLSRTLEEHGVASDGYGTLSVIGAFGPITPKELARRTGRPLTTTSDVVRRLVERGDVRRVPNPDDGRSHLLQLTKRGDSAWRKGWPALRETIRRVGENLDRPLDDVHDAVEDLNEALRRASRTLNTIS